MSTAHSGDPFGPAYRLLDEIAMKHYEMAQLIAGYKEVIERLEERADPGDLRLARSLPGARYIVAETYVREAWLKVDAQIAALFPPEDAQA
ncbi:hypothetical protein [Miltoncostaea marina]|uniref:hypothetical protein n=1 Tax=Miltoncostaea marina TaxID=2843215 RepID=UPI001C3D36D9|nr:hypothetical protein [Miltoncostaea marina]